MSAQGLLSSVFSCSLSPKSISKRRLRQTRSLDPVLMRHYGTDAEESPYKVCRSLLETHMTTLSAYTLTETGLLYGTELELLARCRSIQPASAHSNITR
ncbi:unnamed protein product [Pleuronectes platessa]|uniref:Uncharacterized protein n=1 Tax=Pleuronectes platessa TaxID=8262 RepID=A0A9N7VUT1_PLEPL|nr:unnamed protein product [Pleuronectes platessa]